MHKIDLEAEGHESRRNAGQSSIPGFYNIGTQGVQELFFVMHLKDQGVKIWSCYHFNMCHVFQVCVFFSQEQLRININRWVVMFVIGFFTGLIAFTIDILIILLADQKYTLIKKCILSLYLLCKFLNSWNF